MSDELRRIFDEHHAYVWRSLRRLGVHEADLEDLTHDVFLAVHRKLASYDRARPVRPWLFAFAVRLASDYRKLARHAREVPVTAEPADDAPTAEAVTLAREQRRLLERALARVSLELRSVLVLHDIDETPMRDIAEALEIPLNTAYSRLRLARAQCLAALRKEQP